MVLAFEDRWMLEVGCWLFVVSQAYRKQKAPSGGPEGAKDSKSN
jgi:hypothetical protein